MTPSLLIRPVLALFLTAGVSACGMVDSDPHRFETMARQLASVPLDGGERAAPAPGPAQAAPRPSRESTLRKALTVEVMEDVELWDARYGVMGDPGPVVVEAVAEAVAEPVRARLQPAIDRSTLRQPDLTRTATAPAPRRSGGLVQLGAFSSEQSARAAWTRLRAGGAGWALDGLTPTFEAVSVNGRDLVRLKVRAPAAGAAALCAAAGIDDPWCRRSA
ncbi:SPOR domain-containing protein [Brevundimonas sp. FT23028]|uniref:SPOR domain-containing protein n=1 Tax=Brevundimonas sp. FT23028 TaxID=3393748 RepID=UPI003B58AC2B